MDKNKPVFASFSLWNEIFMRNSMRDFVLFARENELSLSQLGALFHLHNRGECGVTDLGDRLGVTSAAASQMLDRLVQQGFIQRTESPTDRRFKQIALTENGRQILQKGIRARQAWFEDVVRAMTPEELEQVEAAFNILIEKANSLYPVYAGDFSL